VVAGALSNILGSNPNSRLFYNVREEKGLAYNIYSYIDFYRDTGLAGVYFACHPKKVGETIQVVKNQLKKFSRKGCTNQELADVKEQMRGNYLIALESSSTHMWHMIQQEMYLKKHPSRATILGMISKITKDDINQLAKNLFDHKPIAAAVIGPVRQDIHKYLQVLD
jgi:predicted Zn-dependent peptidase